MGTDKPSFERLDLTAKLKDTTVNLSYKMSDLAIVPGTLSGHREGFANAHLRDFEGLYALFDPVVMGASKSADLEGYCTQIEPEYGKPLSFEFRGFAFNKTSAGYEFLSLAGQLKREIKETPLNIAVDLGKPELKGSLNSIKFAY
ncbi:MAG: hypothetical protein IPM82_21820 [Saprospiraceae bacterium]|nr:hypothetical protein [Saprospiraceae bacterium]